MSGGLSEQAIYQGLRDLGFPEHVARQRAREEAGEREHPADSGGKGAPAQPRGKGSILLVGGEREHPPASVGKGARAAGPLNSYLPGIAAIEWPLRLLFPWSHLVSDNSHFTATIVEKDGRTYAKITRTAAYREAMRKMRGVAAGKVPTGAAVSIPLSLSARVWVPDNRPGHDVANFAKGCHDALEGVVYTSDQWLHSIHWLRAGTDIDAPRAEITIAPLP